MDGTPSRYEVIEGVALKRYGAVAIGLHWLIAIGIIGLLLIGFGMTWLDLDTALKFKLYQLHKSFGIAVLALSLLRLFWRLTHRAPPMPAGSKPWEQVTAHLIHCSFYIFMIGMPLIGWLGVSTSPLKMPTVIFGLFTLPHLPFFQEMPGVSQKFFALHEWMAYLLLAMLALHVGAALKHHFLLKNDVVLRMTPRFTHGFLKLLRGQGA